MKYFVLLLIASISLTQCSKETSAFNAEKDTIEFGMVSLRCLDDCIQMYKLENRNLFSQTSPIRFLEDLKYNDQPSTKYDVNKIIKLLNNIPSIILESSENFGCPGCVDEPFILLRFTHGENIKSIKVDIKEYDLPREVKPWVLDFLNLMDELRQL
ncbi:MAG TPA: hypothetical protein PKD85_06585 [Saprospiraceae bacterium]|nr:hypothetical protein [Saprospiraceae bacterium]